MTARTAKSTGQVLAAEGEFADRQFLNEAVTAEMPSVEYARYLELVRRRSFREPRLFSQPSRVTNESDAAVDTAQQYHLLVEQIKRAVDDIVAANSKESVITREHLATRLSASEDRIVDAVHSSAATLRAYLRYDARAFLQLASLAMLLGLVFSLIVSALLRFNIVHPAVAILGVVVATSYYFSARLSPAPSGPRND